MGSVERLGSENSVKNTVCLLFFELWPGFDLEFCVLVTNKMCLSPENPHVHIIAVVA